MRTLAKTDPTGRYLLANGDPSHFTQTEFACHCGCGLMAPTQALIDALEQFRTAIGVPLTITCGSRCLTHNKAVGGATASRHLPRTTDDPVRIIQESGQTGGVTDAADVASRTLRPRDLLQTASCEPHFSRFRGIGLYPSWLHLDLRPGARARWGW